MNQINTFEKNWVRLLSAVVILLSTISLAAAEANKSPSRLDEFLQGLETLQADFRQVLRDGQGRLIEESRGILAIHRPDRFRWDYKSPHEQVIVADGKRLWLYEADLEQVTVRPMEQSLAGTPASLLSGSEDLRSNFKVDRIETKGSATIVTLIPKRADTDFKRVRIRFSGKQLDSMELADKLGQSTLLEFSKVQRNATIDADKFVFTPPPGVDVIGAEDKGG
jgi:outer membrane lipoprotein carrier protein